MSYDPKNEENIINTTIVELFALVIFLFIIALAVTISTSDSETYAEFDSGDDPERVTEKLSDWMIGSSDNVVFMPIFEGKPACIYHASQVEFLGNNLDDGKPRFSKFGIRYSFSMALSKLTGKMHEWEVTKTGFANKVSDMISLEEALCHFYHGKRQGAGSDNIFQKGKCKIRNGDHKLSKVKFNEIRSSFESSKLETNPKWKLRVYHEGGEGAIEYVQGHSRNPKLTSIIDFSRRQGQECRWGILLRVKGGRCNQQTKDTYREALKKLGLIKNTYGYVFGVSDLNGNGDNAAEFDNCIYEPAIGK